MLNVPKGVNQEMKFNFNVTCGRAPRAMAPSISVNLLFASGSRCLRFLNLLTSLLHRTQLSDHVRQDQKTIKMSTFKGKVAEFPDIRIDYFRSDPDPKSRPPLVYFLSHVHSDHLLGLETDSKIITYCTPATRDILLRLEKYPHRMNFAKGILETRTQTYRHRKDRVKAISLEVPTEIELTPGRCMQVTAFDANHCVGACMFLIEGDGKAILYTGDIRSEVWWVNSLVRNPVLLPYACLSNGEPIKRLDCIYLDTTFVANGKEDSLRDFASKAQGIYELLRKVAQYPSSTDFYFDSWTFGYEDVWQALSRALDCRVHLDDYRFNVYSALENSIELLKAREAQTMIIYPSGNHLKPGYLTIAQSRLHSCEKGTGCNIWNKGKNRDSVEQT